MAVNEWERIAQYPAPWVKTLVFSVVDKELPYTLGIELVWSVSILGKELVYLVWILGKELRTLLSGLLCVHIGQIST